MAKSDLVGDYLSNFDPINRVQGNTIDQGVGDLLEELSLNIADDDLIDLKNNWKGKWDVFNQTLKAKQKDAENYWKGKFKYSDLEAKSENRPEADNLIFEALETFLPIVTSKNPEPVVACADQDEQAFVKDELEKLLDQTKFRLKMINVVRNWAIFFVGVGKLVYDIKNQTTSFKAIRPDLMILDPEAVIEGGIYMGSYLGEYRTEKASDVVSKFPKKKAYIQNKVSNKMGTSITYIEWWTNDYIFWTIDNEVLDKNKNPNWNYEETQTTIDEFGQPQEQTVPGDNHLPYPMIPYAFLNVFSLGKSPLDDTSPLYQSLYLQDDIHETYRQIKINVGNTNGGWLVSKQATGFTNEQATQAVNALRTGGAVMVDQDINGVQKITGPGLPNDVYQKLIDTRNELRNIFGTRGSTPQGTQAEKTVRGKIIIGQQDSSRAALITPYIEQFADHVYNLMIQFMKVYGNDVVKAKMTQPMTVSVKEGSTIPKDELSRRNEAIDLYTAGALAPIDLYKRLEDPNPEQSVQNLMQWILFQKTGQMPGQPPMLLPGAPPGMPPNAPGGLPQPANPNAGLPSAQQQSSDLIQSLPV